MVLHSQAHQAAQAELAEAVGSHLLTVQLSLAQRCMRPVWELAHLVQIDPVPVPMMCCSRSPSLCTWLVTAQQTHA